MDLSLMRASCLVTLAGEGREFFRILLMHDTSYLTEEGAEEELAEKSR
jgi:hypothetical protein